MLIGNRSQLNNEFSFAVDMFNDSVHATAHTKDHTSCAIILLIRMWKLFVMFVCKVTLGVSIDNNRTDPFMITASKQKVQEDCNMSK